MLKHRLIFGVIFAACFFAVIYLDSWCSRGWPRVDHATPPGMFVALACVIVIPFALREMRNLLRPEHVIISMRVTVVSAMLCLLWPWMEQVAESAGGATTLPGDSGWGMISRWMRTVKPHYLVPTILAAALVAAFVKHSSKQRVEGAMANAGGTLLAIVYLGVLPGFFLPICMTHSAWMLLAIVCIVKAADIGAYTVGRLFGRHKLIPWLSPGKTIEGFFGGLLFSGAAGAGAAPFFEHFTWPQGIIAGIVLGAVGQIGDLLESLLKRDAGVKDSGRVPGFGGILDLLDSPLLAAPAAYWLLKLLVRA